MFKIKQLLTIAFVALLFIGCAPDDEPAPTCDEAGIYEIPSFSVVIDSTLTSDESNKTYWICDGGDLTISGQNNTVLVSAGGKLTLNGNGNTAYVLGFAEIVVYADEQTLWLNGESQTTNRGDDNTLNYYKIGMLNEYGERTVINDLCGNVEVDFTNAPEGGCP